MEYRSNSLFSRIRNRAASVFLAVSAAVLPAYAQRTVDIALGQQDATFYGADVVNRLTEFTGIAHGDLNNDGVGDLVLGAPRAANAKGAVYVFFGPLLPGMAKDLATDAADVTVYGADAAPLTDYLGFAVAAGDVSGDGVDDLVVSAVDGDGPSNSRDDAGEIQVLFGPFSSGTTIDLAVTAPDVTVYGVDSGDQAGWSLALGDVSSDAIGDILVGAPRADGITNLQTDTGEAYVLFGPFASGTSRDLNTNPADVIVYGADSGDWLGYALDAGDVTADATDDLILGAYQADGPSEARPDCGEIDILFGPLLAGRIVDLKATQGDVKIYGADAEDRLGNAVKTGDLSGDSAEDIVAGAWGGDGPANLRTDSGEVHALFGPVDSGAVFDLNATAANVTAYGRDAGDELGWSVATGDLTGDSVGDVLAGARKGAGPDNARTSAGEAYALRGPFASGTAIDMAAVTADTTIYGADNDDRLGNVVATGDVSGDGIHDILAGAYFADANGKFDAGAAYAIFSEFVPSCMNPPEVERHSLKARRMGARKEDLEISFDASDIPSLADHVNGYRGEIGTFYNHSKISGGCGLLSPPFIDSGAATPGTNYYYIFAYGCADGTEGTYGQKSDGSERPMATDPCP